MSRIITETSTKVNLNQAFFWLYFHIGGFGTEWIDYGLPYPSYHKHINKGYLVGWAVEGYFSTPKAQDFLNDIIARFLLSFDAIERLNYCPKIDDKTAKIYQKIYGLKAFSRQLKSLPAKKKIPRRAEKFDDFTFWAIKLYAEDLIKTNGFIVYDNLESWALSQFLEHKEKSTIKAKCKSVWQWYYHRDFQLPKNKRYRYTKEETMASRSEHMRQLKKREEENNKKKIINLITGLYSFEYKKKSGSWHISKIAKTLKMSRNTVAKHLKEFEQKTGSKSN